MKEPEINEKFKQNGIVLQCVEEPAFNICSGCYFEGCLNKCMWLVCSMEDRKDKKNVIFKKVDL